MALFIVITLIAVGILVATTLTVGFEGALPFFAFLVILLPGESRISFGDLFVVTSTRVIIATMVVLFFALGNQHPKSDRNNRLPLKYLLILYVVWRFVSTLNSVVFMTSLRVVLDNTLEFYLLYYILARSISNVKTIHKILAASIAALVVCCAFGAVERFTHWRVADLFPVVLHRLEAGEGGRLGPGDRLRSTFPHPILYANALALGIPWVLYFLSLAKTAAQKICLWGALIMMTWNIYKTGSRGPWLALAMSLVVLFFFLQGSIRKYLLVIAFLTVATLIVRPGVLETLTTTYHATRDPDSLRGTSYQYRYELMHAGVRAISHNVGRALWGFGPESFYHLGLEAEVALTGKTEELESCDSAWVEVMIEAGYVGLFLVAALLMGAALLSWKGFKTVPPPANSLCLVFMVSIGAYAFMMLSVEDFGWGQQTFMLWMILAMSVVYPRLASSGASLGKRSFQALPEFEGNSLRRPSDRPNRALAGARHFERG
jgi:hypothetical protein